MIFNYLKNFLNKSSCSQLEHIFDLSEKYMSHPYIFIQPHKQIYDEISKISLKKTYFYNLVCNFGERNMSK